MGDGRERRAAVPTAGAHVEIVDCTLRDGEQTPGVWFTLSEKVELAGMLDLAGVDVLDAGFPAACDEDVEALQELAQRGLRARLAATARPLPADVQAAARARAQEVFIFLPTSDQHLATKLRLDRVQAAHLLRTGLEEALALGLVVNFVAEDALRADPVWLRALITDLADLPVARVVVCDTVGAATPRDVEDLVRALAAVCPPETRLCMHCHDDFGLAGANTLAGVAAGATSVSCTVNGIGERAGNASLADVVAGLVHLLGAACAVDPRQLSGLAATVERMSGVDLSPLAPVVGHNVYAHESGVHVDGMLKHARNYEHLPAAWSGATTRYVLGKHSGLALVRRVLAEAGVEAGDDQLLAVLRELKQRAVARDKTAHHDMHRAVVQLRHETLGGISRDELVALARSLLG